MLGGLSLFLYGVTRLSISLKKLAGKRMKRILERFTSNIVMAVLLGILVTVALDSSSVTIILVIALVNAQVMALQRALAVILGANIGTTVSSQIIAFQVEVYASLLLVVGFVIYFAGNHKKTTKYLGLVLFAFGLIFFGLGMMSHAVEPLKEHHGFTSWIRYLESPPKGVLVGALITAIIQSSSATMGIVITMASQKLISLGIGITVMLGAEVGTCADTLLASIGRSREAIKAGIFHFGFNVVCVLIGLLFTDTIANVAATISPSNVARQIANAHMIFNIGGVLLFVAFIPKIDWLLDKVVPQANKKVIMAEN
ncbi:Na/Pi cotransporter family protein [Chryseosolibacter indicus]|uniref:Na/Pi cotransporter family protein n=1 Tax=Chryseosolibacter indicus TaxID=2782351 RepID=UPI0020B18DF1